MGRLKAELLERVEIFADRVLDVAVALERKGCWRRILDQIVGSGTSVGANVFEADEALSRSDFLKCIGIAVKELNETRYWLRLIARRQWIAASRLAPLQIELDELKKVLGTIHNRTRKSPTRNTPRLG
jgi:four helix bundle protein